jgi:Mn2+/Fe2+ NRAMP family transporter
MKVMRIDNSMAYVLTGIFVIAMLVVGAEVVRAAGVSLSAGDAGLLDLSDVLNERYGEFIGSAFLVGFWAASFSSVLGVWNGVSLMFADFWGNMRGVDSGHPSTRIGGKYFKFYLVWLTFPPMVLLLLDRPIGLILVYGVLGALFMPFLAVTLLGLLNGRRIPMEWPTSCTPTSRSASLRRCSWPWASTSCGEPSPTSSADGRSGSPRLPATGATASLRRVRHM